MIYIFKSRYTDPKIIVAVDWNRANTDLALSDFSTILPVPTPPTRGDEVLDIVFTNVPRTVTAVEVCPPLAPNLGRPGRPSDHNLVCVALDLPRSNKLKWLKYSYCKYTKEGDAAFGEWLADHPWAETVGSPSDKAEALGTTLDWAMNQLFPLISRRLRSDQDPWINKYLEAMIERRKKFFKIQGRSKSWKKVKKKTEELIRERKRGYLGYQVEKAVELGGLGNRIAGLELRIE